MKISKRARTIILWCVAIGLLLGMVITFTPTLGLNFASQEALRGTVQLTVNGSEIREAEVAQAQQGTVFGAVSEGPVAAQLQRLLVDQLVRQEVVRQAAAPMRVTNAEVRDEVDAFRESRGVGGRRNDQAYLSLIRAAGFSDETFREYVREQLKLAKWEESVVGNVTVSDAEVEAYYLSHLSDYQTEERVRARQIVVSERETVEALRAQVLAGASFAELAADHSLELADRQGAVGAQVGETEPRPVSRAAFPTAVASAAFALRGAGLTDVIAAADGFYVVQVEEYLPATARPLDEVRAQVEEDAVLAKKQGVIEAEVERLRRAATVTFPATSQLSFENPPVAKVGDVEITEVDLDRATYLNASIQQALTPDTAELIVQLFRPAILQQLIDVELAYQGASTLGVGFVGTKAAVAQAALDYVARDVTVTDAEVEEYYRRNLAAYTQAAEADVTTVEFADLDAATAFRTAVVGGAEVAAPAEGNGGALTAHGRVRRGALEAAVDTLVFDTDAFEDLPGGSEVSDIVVVEREAEPAEGGEEPATVERYVVVVATRTPERVRPLEDIRAQVEAAVLATNRQAAQDQWLASLREQVEVRELSVLDLFGGFGVPEVQPADEPLVDDASAGEGQPADEQQEE